MDENKRKSMGMSSVVKNQIVRELKQLESEGRRTVIVDPKSEYEALAKGIKKRDIVDPFSIDE